MALCHSIQPYRGWHYLTGSRAETDALATLEAEIGHVFSDRKLLVEALTHASHGPSATSYERLEFLGDRVLGIILADHFYGSYPQDDEGGLSLRFHAAARQSTLAGIARALNIAAHVRSQSGMDVAANDSILADVVESLMAAIYLDGGLEPARSFVLTRWPFDTDAPAKAEKDAKSQLQEFAMRRGVALPKYRLVARTGPDHAPELTYAVAVDGFDEVEATAGSRKQAEQMAAAQLLARIGGKAGRGAGHG